MTDPVAYMADLAAAQEELESITLSSFTNADAWNLGSWAYETARDRQLPFAIDVRRGDQQLFHAALAGTTPDNDAWIERKIRSVRRFQMASLRLGQLYGRHLGGFHEATRLPHADYAAAGGCVPIIVRDVGMIGTFTVSGLPEEIDHAFAIEGLKHLASSIDLLA